MVESKGRIEYKIAVIGSTGVGKSSLCLQFTRNKFQEKYEPTIEDYYRREAVVDGDPIVFDIIDTAGQEGNLTNLSMLINQASGFLLVYDIVRMHSYIELQKFYDRILDIKNTNNPPIVLVGNKLDIAGKREVSVDEGMSLARKWKCKFWEVSAKTKNNLETAFYECARLIRQNEIGRYEVKTCCLLL